MIGWPEMVGILVVVLVLPGAKRIPELARGLGQDIKGFKKATREFQDEIEPAAEEEPRNVTPESPTLCPVDPCPARNLATLWPHRSNPGNPVAR